jgi:hypothetical protein
VKITKFENEKLFKNDQEKDAVEHKFGFSEVDLQEYAAKIETKAEKHGVKEVQVSANIEDDLKKMT